MKLSPTVQKWLIHALVIALVTLVGSLFNSAPGAFAGSTSFALARELWDAFATRLNL